MLQSLKIAGVDTTFVRKHVGSRTSTAAVIVDGHGERLVVSERDHAMPGRPDWIPLESLSSAGAVLSDKTWHEATVAAFRRARTHHVPTVLDIDVAGGRPSDEILESTDFAIFSAEALNTFIESGSRQEKLTRLASRGIQHAGVTLGSNGYSWMDRTGKHHHQNAFDVEIMDTTGAGDAFHGAFAWALACGKKEAECARIASAVAALNCRRTGARAGLPTNGELEAFLVDRSGDGNGNAEHTTRTDG